MIFIFYLYHCNLKEKDHIKRKINSKKISLYMKISFIILICRRLCRSGLYNKKLSCLLLSRWRPATLLNLTCAMHNFVDILSKLCEHAQMFLSNLLYNFTWQFYITKVTSISASLFKFFSSRSVQNVFLKTLKGSFIRQVSYYIAIYVTKGEQSTYKILLKHFDCSSQKFTISSWQLTIHNIPCKVL